jgi:uncharacterized protein YkwD
MELSNKKIISGYKNGAFKPNDTVTKAQAAKIVYGALGLKTVPKKNSTYIDVSKNHWAYKNIVVLTEMKGFTAGKKFYPNNALTRAEMAKLIIEPFGFTKTSSKKFVDVKLNSWYSGYVNKLYASGITTGVTKDRFNPEGKVTRAQIAVFLSKAMKLKKAKEIEYDPNDFLYSPEEQKVFAMENLKALNEIRKKANLPLFVYNEEYSKLATLKAKDMFDNNYLEHDSTLYGSPSDMFRTFGYNKLSVGENILKGTRYSRMAIEGWMLSPGHKAVIMSDYGPKPVIAIAVYGEKWTDNVYWVNMFVQEVKE